MSFSSETRDRSAPVLPLAGMLDVMFLLLIFFMTTSLMREQETAMEVNLQKAQSGKSGANSIATNITVSEDGKVYIAGFEYSIDALQRKLAEIASAFPNQPVVIRGDKNSALGRTVEIMDMCRRVGLTNVGIAARKQAGDL